ncbi:hypothetical protein GCM10009792_03450 [Microcella alkalica]|uniref:Uncharacterized protein with FMN-binding domain n=1 Tax=Microcella alkalica TaxID=355930 RepID=A0A839E8Q2_9MICO|nr:hypothetical protein [Microcella alkalica]MBA8849029.1 uncharacterized protein with FMN-binding domain [Microcella alkalica]
MTRSSRLLAAPLCATAAVTLLGTLSGCAAGDVSGAPAPTEPATGADADTSAAYEDGGYAATGEYQSPNGGESIIVELTLEGDIVTDVVVTTNANNPTTQRFQNEFAGGIAAEVVGKDIDTLEVTRVAGSSLTSGGFRQAIETIKADALVG